MPHCPGDFAEDYSISSIIKDTADKKVYLLKDQHNQSFILKCCSAMYANALQQEYDFLTHHTNMDCFPGAVTFFEESDVRFLLRDYIKGPLLGEHSEHLYARYTHFRDFENALLPYMMECCQIISILHIMRNHPLSIGISNRKLCLGRIFPDTCAH